MKYAICWHRSTKKCFDSRTENMFWNWIKHIFLQLSQNRNVYLTTMKFTIVAHICSFATSRNLEIRYKLFNIKRYPFVSYVNKEIKNFESSAFWNQNKIQKHHSATAKAYILTHQTIIQSLSNSTKPPQVGKVFKLPNNLCFLCYPDRLAEIPRQDWKDQRDHTLETRIIPSHCCAALMFDSFRDAAPSNRCRN